MKIRRVRKITYITFTNATLQENQEYVGKSFEAVVANDTITKFIDWLNGNGEVVPVGDYTQGEGWDIKMFDDAFAEKEVQVVANRLQQKLSIQQGELAYPFEPTSELIGVPFVNKKTKEELDMILKSEINSTEGVKTIAKFVSSMDENRKYSVEFVVITTGGESAWLSTEI